MLRNIIDYIFGNKISFPPIEFNLSYGINDNFIETGLLTLKPKQIGDLEPLIGAWKEDIVLNISYIVLCNYL